MGRTQICLTRKTNSATKRGVSPGFAVRFIGALLLIVLFSLQALSAERVDHLSKLRPGDIFSVRIRTHESPRSHEKEAEAPVLADFYRVTVQDAEGETLSEGRSFFRTNGKGADGTNSTREAFILLGIPSAAEAGSYLLNVYRVYRGDENTELLLQSRRVEILDRSFKREEIPLRETLTELRRSPDPEKTHQAREIRRIYWSFRADTDFAKGPWIVPVEYSRISGDFGDRRIYQYSDGGRASWIHSGIDFAAPVGTPIRAPAEGRVVMAEERIVTGKTLVLEHLPGIYSIYFHLDSLEVKDGAMVQKGERIGSVGMSGLATGPHLHWEVRVQGVAVDPWGLTKERFFATLLATEEP